MSILIFLINVENSTKFSTRSQFSQLLKHARFVLAVKLKELLLSFKFMISLKITTNLSLKQESRKFCEVLKKLSLGDLNTMIRKKVNDRKTIFLFLF